MESRIRVLFLITLVDHALGLCSHEEPVLGIGRDEAPPPTCRATEGRSLTLRWSDARSRNRRSIARISRLAIFAGLMSIEDFGSDAVYGVRLAYHVTEGFFVEAIARSI